MKTMKQAVIGIVSLILILSCYAQENTTNSDKAEKINELISLYTDYGGFNGAVLVAHEGEIIHQKGYGLANMEWDIPNEIDTKFQIASLTKSFTAMLIMQLVAKGELDLNQSISTYLPDYPKKTGEAITIHHLLTHSSGIKNVNKEEKVFRPKEMVEQFAHEPLEFTPGERFDYSNSGYTLLGYIVEIVTEKSYEEVLETYIFKPLKMKNSGFYKHRPLIKNMSSGYNKIWGDYYDIDYSDASSAYAAGGIYSTVEDLLLWEQAMYNETLLPKKYMDMIFTKHIEDVGYGGHYGYGWELLAKPIGNTEKKIETIGHSGSINGYCALITRISSTNSSIIFLGNTRRAFLNSMTTAITGILADKPYDFPLKPLAQFMAEEIKKEGLEKGIDYYKAYKDSDAYYVSEQELIIEGYRFLHAENASDAAKIFQLTIEVFPDRDNPYDSYAEALMELGEYDEAIKNYKKSLEINPDNKNAEKMLEKISGMKE